LENPDHYDGKFFREDGAGFRRLGVEFECTTYPRFSYAPVRIIYGSPDFDISLYLTICASFDLGERCRNALVDTVVERGTAS
jgi:hypothetical protein